MGAGCRTASRRTGVGTPGVVPPTGFEPVISTLKGWRPRPLDDGGSGAGTAGRVYQSGPRVPLQIRLMMTPRPPGTSGAADRDQPAEQRRHAPRSRRGRRGRPGPPRRARATAIAANTSPNTAKPVAMSGTWSVSRTKHGIAEEPEAAQQCHEEHHPQRRDPDAARCAARGASAGRTRSRGRAVATRSRVCRAGPAPLRRLGSAGRCEVRLLLMRPSVAGAAAGGLTPDRRSGRSGFRGVVLASGRPAPPPCQRW